MSIASKPGIRYLIVSASFSTNGPAPRSSLSDVYFAYERATWTN